MSSKLRILISCSNIPQSALDILKDKYQLVMSPGDPPSREQLLKDVRGAVGILWFSKVKIDKEMVEAAGKQLKVVGLMSSGYDHIDVPLLKSRDIKVTNCTNVVNSAVAEVAIGLLLSTSRRLLEGYKAILSDKWVLVNPIWMCGQSLDKSTVGIIGLGGIGLAIAKRLKPFEVSRILYSGRTEKKEAKPLGAEFVPLDSLLRESDFVIIACALNDETRHLLNKSNFQKMKPTSVLVNISRGDIVQQDDLITALRDGVIGGAGLDVTTPEPLPSNHPLTKLPNCVLSPHLGTASLQTRAAMAELAAQNIFNALNNKPLISPL